MMLVTTASELDGYHIHVTKGLAQGATFENMLHHAEQLGANAIVNAAFESALKAGFLFHGDAVVVQRIGSKPVTGLTGSEYEKR